MGHLHHDGQDGKDKTVQPNTQIFHFRMSSCGSHQPTRVMPMKSSVENFIIQKKSDTGNSPVSATALMDDSHNLHDSKTMVSRKSKAFLDPGKP